MNFNDGKRALPRFEELPAVAWWWWCGDPYLIPYLVLVGFGPLCSVPCCGVVLSEVFIILLCQLPSEPNWTEHVSLVILCIIWGVNIQ